MPKDGELPFQRVMLRQEYGHMNPRLAEDVDGHALLVFTLAKRWNGWLKQTDEANAADKAVKANKPS